MRLWRLLEKPISSFATSASTSRTFSDRYLYTGANWWEELKVERFLIERIQRVNRLLEDSLMPLRAYETVKDENASLSAIQKAMKPLYAYPFGPNRASATHSASVHLVHRYRAKTQKDPELFYFIAHEAKARRYECDWTSFTTGTEVIRYILQNAPNGKIGWRAALPVLTRARGLQSSCARALLKEQPEGKLRLKRGDEILKLVQSGRVQFPSSSFKKEKVSTLQSLEELIASPLFSAQERLVLYRRWRPKMKGSEKEEKKLAERILKAFEPAHNKRNAKTCNRYFDVVEEISSSEKTISLQDAEEHLICECLKPGSGFTGSRRKLVVTNQAQHARRVCKWVQNDEWPGGMGTRPRRPPVPEGARKTKSRRRDKMFRKGAPANPWDVASVIKSKIKTCLMHTDVESPYNGVLNSIVQLWATAGASGISQVRSNIEINRLPKELQFDRETKKTGWVRQSDMRRTEKAVQQCIEKAALKLQIPNDSPLSVSTKSRVWLYFSSSDIVDAYLL